MQQSVPSSWGIFRYKLETSTVTRMVSGGYTVVSRVEIMSPVSLV